MIANRARTLIANHAHFRGRADAFDFEIDGDVLIIRGCVPTFYLKQLLQDALKQLPGVYRIDNRVDVFAYADASSLCHADSM
jgi:hypothetical protein